MRKERTGIQLANPYDRKKFDAWRKPALLQPKLNGERCRILLTPGEPATLLSSTADLITSVPHIQEVCDVLAMKVVAAPLELDGELYKHGMPLEDIHSIVSRKYESTLHNNYEEMEFHCFDLANEHVQGQRYVMHRNIFNGVFRNLPFIKPVETMLVETHEDVMQHLEHYYSQGYEGIIVRDTLSHYTRKHFKGMLKFKPRASDVYVIVDFVEAVSQHGTPKGMLGAVVCENSSGGRFEVGAGRLTHPERTVAWLEREDYKGGFCECMYQTLTATKRIPYAAICVKIFKNGVNQDFGKEEHWI